MNIISSYKPGIPNLFSPRGTTLNLGGSWSAILKAQKIYTHTHTHAHTYT